MNRPLSSFTSPRILLLRRLVFLVPAVLLSLAGAFLAWEMSTNQPGETFNWVDVAPFAVFCVLFAMLAFTSWAAMLGLGLWLAGRRQVPLEKEAAAIPANQLVPSRTTRTAILIPAYHENPVEVFARVRVMQESLARLQPEGSRSDIDIFVLSDSQNPEAVEAEAKAYKSCIAALKGKGPAVYYRRRTANTEYKVGNIKEFCTRWGGAYNHMLVLDADSLMAGDTIRRMIVLMERHPRIGLLQTCFIPVHRDTLFCRVMHFSTRLYLMPAAMGLEFWQGANGNYWGHNALIRTRAFTESCGLPELPGKAPLGGRILSHDIVEAAFIARGGWEAWLLPNIGGTYEELPTNLIDFMQRDRRWCAGNLQHQHIIRAQGVHFGNRLHMVLGILSYVTGPLWLAFIVMSVAAALAGAGHTGMHLATAGVLTSNAPAHALFALTMVLLFAPKLGTLTLALARPSVRRSFGGGARLLAGALLEQIFIMLQQPAVMMFYTTFVAMPLMGQVVKWEAQPRSERGIGWNEAFLRHRYHLLAAAGTLLLLAASGNTTTMLWLSPVMAGLFLSPAFTVLTSRSTLGQKLRNWGLFLTQDELTPSPELKALQTLLAKPMPVAPHATQLPKLPEESPATMEAQPLRHFKKPATTNLNRLITQSAGSIKVGPLETPAKKRKKAAVQPYPYNAGVPKKKGTPTLPI